MVSSLSASQQMAAAAGAVGTLHNQLPCTQRYFGPANLQLSYNGLRKCGLWASKKDAIAALQSLNSTGKPTLSAPIASAAAPPSTTVSIPSLNDLPLNAFINSHGRIVPPVEPNTEASVFAVFDKNKKAQYIGFSKDLRNSLRILMGRRPEYCYFYKMFNLPSLDQATMLEARKQWMSELGAAPDGNADPVQRQFWEQPVSAGSISERGKVAAAKAKARTLLQMFTDRGITEEMVYDPKLLEEGKCDILPTKLPQADLDQSAAGSEDEEPVTTKSVSIKTPSGSTVDYEIAYELKYKTNGGWMYDIAVTRDDTLTRHRVIVGRMFPEAVKMPEDEFLETIMGFLLHKRIPRHTEGLLDASTFPINYFAITQVCQFFKDVNDWFPCKLPNNFWRFMRTELYGPAIDPPPELGPTEKVSIYE